MSCPLKEEVKITLKLSPFPKNNILGTYIRERLGLNLSRKFFSHLDEYGRHHVEIKKLKEGQYEINFSEG